MAQFVVLETAGNGIPAAQDTGAGHHARRDPVGRGQVVGFVIGYRGEVRGDVLANLLEIRLGEGFDARRDALVAQEKHRHVVFARDVDRLDGGIETLLDVRRRDDHARSVPVAAEHGQVQI